MTRLQLIFSCFAGALALTPACALAAKPPPGDINGDGLSDLVIGVPFESLPSVPGSNQGAVDIINGGAFGAVLPAPATNAFSQDTTGIDGDGAENGDLFGLALATGDFNGDGKADVAIGVPSESLRGDGAPGASIEGAVNVIYGSGTGLTEHGDRFITQDTLGIAGDGAESGDQFGSTLATGDFNGDGFADLALGTPQEDLGPGLDLKGAVNVIYGSKRGLTPTGNRFLTQSTKGMAGNGATFGDEFGTALATGDLNGDRRADLAIGAPGRFGGSETGEVNVVYGGDKGLTAKGSAFFTQDTPGVADQPEAGDGFGRSLAIGDLNGDGRAELAIGSPFEDVPPIGGGTAIHDAGMVNVLYGSSKGVSGKRSAFVTQDRPDGIAGDGAEANDRFGYALAIGRFNADAFGDLAISSPQEAIFSGGQKDFAGVVNVLGGRTQHGFAAPGANFNEGSFTDSGGVEANAGFGSSLAVGRLNDDPIQDLAIGVPTASQPGANAAGAVGVLFGSGPGLTLAGNQFFNQGDTGLGSSETADFFGSALAP